MTKEEHVARAMLLGLRYNKAGNYYYDEMSPMGRRERMDADTLEPLTSIEALTRAAKGIGHHDPAK